MKNYLDQLVTESQLDIVINGAKLSYKLHDTLIFDSRDSVIVDGIEILPKYRHLAEENTLKINEPFYCWYHRISGQGWLLNPH